MNMILIKLIGVYQRYISPKKGFCCAHHQVHKKGSCSEAIKCLIYEKGFLKAIPDIRRRFKDCTLAYQYLSLKTPPLPTTDMPCDISFGGCDFGGNTALSSTCYMPCEIFSGFSSNIQRFFTFTLFLILLVCAYFFYGKTIGSVYIQQLGSEQQSILKKLIQRNTPEIKVLLISNGKKYYSQPIKIESSDIEYKLTFLESPTNNSIDSLKILDARINIGNDFLVLGQVLEEFKQPLQEDSGKRFKYRLKQRWDIF